MKHATSILLFAVCLVGSIAFSGQLPGSSYMPETGRAAIQQKCEELRGGAVVVYFALQPGFEDFTLLTHLRLGTGALGGVVYVSNGECTPGDLGGLTPLEVAADRKEEAYDAMQKLGMDARFLNFPDPGAVASVEELGRIWEQDSLMVRVKEVLKYYRPDVVVVGGDLRGDSLCSMRQRLMVDVLRNIIDTVSTDVSTKAKPAKLTSGVYPRLYVEEEGRGSEKQYDRKHTVFGKTYRAIAMDVAHSYATLKLQLPHWMRGGDRRYTMVFPDGSTQPESMTSGLPVVGPRMRSVRNVLRGLVFDKRDRARTPALAQVVRAIDTLDVFLARNRGPAIGDEVRVLARWKNAIEALRCALLNVKVDYTVSDSLITQDQLIHLKFQSVTSSSSGLSTKIFFPQAMDHTWGVNQSLDYQFDLKPPQDIPVITPHQLRFTLPGAQSGIKEQLLRTRFSFNVIHRDRDRTRDYIYKGEVRFRIGPKRSFEVLTPAVRAVQGASVICRLQNFSYDPYQGTLSITDSLSRLASTAVRLGPKDSVLVDTLRLQLAGTLPEGDHMMEVSLSGGWKLPLIVRSFEAAIDSQARIGVLTSMKASPIIHALDRLGLKWERALSSSGDMQDLSRWNVLLFDRDAVAAFPSIASEREKLAEWIQRGGHLVVLPQTAVEDGGASFGMGARFRSLPLLAPQEAIRIDSTSRLARYPNMLASKEWGQWVVSRAMGSVALDPGVNARVLVSSRKDNTPLVVSLPVGDGAVTLVALDLVSQCLNVHPGVHRILANLLVGR
jgi:hypothetical protein